MYVKKRTDTQRFWGKVDKSGTCWLWLSGKDKDGYGIFHVDGVKIKSHRFSFAETYGSVPAGILVCHRCDNPACVRPDHLFAGTQMDNMRDAASKGRTALGDRNGSRTHPESRCFGDDNPSRRHPERMLRGEQKPDSKLKEADIVAIRQMGGSHQEIAERFGVSRRNISMIRAGETWKHVQ